MVVAEETLAMFVWLRKLYCGQSISPGGAGVGVARGILLIEHRHVDLVLLTAFLP